MRTDAQDTLPAELERLTSTLAERVGSLRVLVAGWEGGVLQCLVEDPEVHGRLAEQGFLHHADGHDTVSVDIGRAGGMAVVVAELPGQVARAAALRGLEWRLASVAPLFTDAVRMGGRIGLGADVGRALWQALATEETGLRQDFEYGGHPFPVRFWKLHTPTTTQYLVQQDELWGPGRLAARQKPGGGSELDIYGVPEGWGDDFPLGVHDPRVLSTRHGMARFQRMRYLIFARALAHLYQALGCDLLVANDYHVGITPFFDSAVRQMSIWHNLGYQGVDAFYCPDDASAHVPIGEDTRAALVGHYGALTGIPVAAIEDYFVAWRREGFIGTPNWAQAVLRLNYHQTGLAGTTVSTSYARQLATEDRAHVIERVREQRGPLPEDYFDPARAADRLHRFFEGETERDDFYVPTCDLPDLPRYFLEGVLNGMHPDRAHLRRRDDLFANMFVALAGRGADRNSRVRALAEALGFDNEPPWLTALGCAGEIEAGTRAEVERSLLADGPRPEDRIRSVEHLLTVKKLAREILAADPKLAGLRNAGDDLPILFSWGRLVSQKAFHVIAEAADRLTERAVLVVLATAPAADREGLWVERRLAEIDDPRFIFINEFNPWLRDLCLLAASIAPLTSLYEPCGLTDIEAYWFGTLCVVHEVGGLVKGMADEAPHYDQIRRVAPAGAPVCRGYRWWDATDPRGEAAAFATACDDLLDLYQSDRRGFARLQLKALDLMQLTWDIPANRYVDLLQFTWFSQVWRWLKDTGADDPTARMLEYLAGDPGFAPGPDGAPGCAGSLQELYMSLFVPPRAGAGVAHLDVDLALDHELKRRIETGG